jgi:hypothetical protein
MFARLGTRPIKEVPKMRRFVVLSLVASALAAMVGQANAQVPRHFHSFATPSGKTHTIAQGLTTNAPCEAFLNFHGIVHTEVFGVVGGAEGKNPRGPLSAQVIQPMQTCP